MDIFFSIILCIISIITFLFSYFHFKRIKNDNDNILQEKKEIEKNIEILKNNKIDLEVNLTDIQNNINEANNIFAEINANQKIAIENQNELAREAFENYCKILDNEYLKVEQEYTTSVELLGKSYSAIQLKYIHELDDCKKELDKMKASRDAIIQARLREQEMEEHSDFYTLSIDDIDKVEISMLETVKTKLSKPRVLSMLIWSTYYQKPLKELAAKILGSNTVIGIYKITSLKTGQCYIGQSVDVAKRWSEHAKCGLGIDTPAGNKLYKAMQRDGLESFSWELLETCPAAQLNEKEKFYINLYDSYNTGYNSNQGNN